MSVNSKSDALPPIGGTATRVFGLRVVGKLTRLGLLSLLARSLEAGGFGVFNVLIAIVEILSRASNIGGPNVLVRFFPALTTDKRRGLLKSVTWVSVVVSVLLGAGIYVSTDVLSTSVFHDVRFRQPLRVVGVGLPIGSFFFLATRSSRAVNRPEIDAAAFDVGQPLAHILFVIPLIISGFGVTSVVVAYFAAAAIIAVPAWRFIATTATAISLDGTRQRQRETIVQSERWWTVGGHFLVIELAVLALAKTDRIMLGGFGTSEAVGLYSAAAAFAVQVPVFLRALNTVLAPRISSHYASGSTEAIKEEFKRVSRWAFILSLIPATVFVSFPDQWLLLFGGETFARGSVALVVLVGGQLVNVACGSVSFLLTMTGHERSEFFNSLFLAVLNIALNFILIPPFGIVGAAAATALSFAGVNLVRLAQVTMYYNVTPFSKGSAKAVISFLGALLATRWVISTPADHVEVTTLIVGCVLGVGVYLIGLLVFGLDSEDRDLLSTALRRLKGY